MSQTITFAALQWNGQVDFDHNRPLIETLLASAAEQGASHVLLPENLAAMPRRMEDLHALAEDESGPIHAFLAEQAHRHRLWLVAGSIPYRRGSGGTASGKLRARSLLYSPEGHCVGHYDKMHLFDVTLPGRDESYRESAVFEPGEQPVVLDAGGVPLGMSICYDLRFPELYRALTLHGARVLLVPAAFTDQTGRVHWEILLRSRAIENQCYVVAAGQVGRHANARATWGHSMVIDPWGEILANARDASPGMALARLELARQQELRQRFPVLEHRRPSSDF